MRDPEDHIANPGVNPSFSEVLHANLRRRRLLQGGLSAAALKFLGLPAAIAPRHASAGPFGFAAVPTAVDDQVHVSEGYVAEVLYAWGDPVSDGPVFAADASNS